MDALAGPYSVRVVGAVGCVVTVLLAARIARLLTTETAARWNAVVAAALVTTPLIDAVAVKGELLALPLVMSTSLVQPARGGPSRGPAARLCCQQEPASAEGWRWISSRAWSEG